MSQRGTDERHPSEVDEYSSGIQDDDRRWLDRIRVGFQISNSYLDDGVRKEWENALARFQNEHPQGSKYHSPLYRGRSKHFRPKTRSYARRVEATAAKALFSNSDLINVQGQNKGSAVQAASALLNKQLLQYRLEHSIPWFSTSMGARQDAFNYGVCISIEGWLYEEEETEELVPVLDELGQPLVDPETGEELGEPVRSTRIVKDRPYIDLIPPENFRFDPNADWRNPVADSPFLTVMMPMYAYEVIERGQKRNPVTGEPEWREYTLAQILAADGGKTINEVIRQARQGRSRQDPLDSISGDEFSPVWVHLNIVRDGGRDWAFYSLGTTLLLTDPVPAEELLPLGREAITVGFSIIEAHRTYPIGGNRLAAPMQSEINDLTNQRMDNVKLALNKRYILRRNANVDTSALMRSVPGGGVMAEDPDRDVRVLDFPDVTGSSYQEHDRLAQELDELAGMFSGSSVQANRSLNETVGGMNLLQGDANDVSEYELRVWIETWVEPVLRKLQKLEAMFETDETVLALAAENAEIFQRYGQGVELDRLIDHELIVSVNVGMGNTNPQQRLQRFGAVLQTAGSIPEISARLNGEEVGREVFALGGFDDGERFFVSEEELAQRQQAQQAPDSSVEVAKIRAQAEMQKHQETLAFEAQQRELDRQQRMGEKAAELNLKLKDLYEKIGVERDRNQTARDVAAVRENSKTREMNLKARMGSGI